MKNPRTTRWFDGDASVGVPPQVENWKDARAACAMLEDELDAAPRWQTISNVPSSATPMLLFRPPNDYTVCHVRFSDLLVRNHAWWSKTTHFMLIPKPKRR